MPVLFFHRTQESTEYTVLTHIGVWVKTKINILYPRCKFNILYRCGTLCQNIGFELPLAAGQSR